MTILQSSQQFRYFRWLSAAICFFWAISLGGKPALALSPSEAANPVPAAAMNLVQFCIDPKASLDLQAVASLADYVLEPKQKKELALPKFQDCTGAYYEFDTKITFPRFLEYSYNAQIPSILTRPSSLRYSLWTGQIGESQKLPTSWNLTQRSDKPIIIRGFQHDSNTPDLTTGVYHEYDLKRTLIMFNHKGRQVLISISKQLNKSDVGKKGVIVGNDDDWNYYYSNKPGSTKAGLGWVKSYIYDYFSVGIYVESSSSPTMVRAGVFQWLRAGWSGINFVQSSHIITGMKRFSHNAKSILESPNLPSPTQMSSVYQRLSALSANDLTKKYSELQQSQKSSAIRSGKIDPSEAGELASCQPAAKEQMIEELMLEYLKIVLGKPSLMEKNVLLAFN